MSNVTKIKSTRDALERVEDALESISKSLSEMDNLVESLNPAHPRVIDIAARINAQQNALKKILEPLKDSQKAESLRVGEETIKGVVYQAEVRRITKTVLDTTAVKLFLGKNVYKYQVDRDETNISYKVKE